MSTHVYTCLRTTNVRFWQVCASVLWKAERNCVNLASLSLDSSKQSCICNALLRHRSICRSKLNTPLILSSKYLMEYFIELYIVYCCVFLHILSVALSCAAGQKTYRTCCEKTIWASVRWLTRRPKEKWIRERAWRLTGQFAVSKT